MVIDRLLPFWNDVVVREIKAGKRVLIVAHGSSLRAIVKHVESLTDEQITKVRKTIIKWLWELMALLLKNILFQTNVPTGIPFVYDLDENCKAVKEREVKYCGQK